MRKALITGITGQDGSYLAEFLIGKGYEVHGLKRRASSFNTDRVDHLYEDLHQSGTRLFLHYADLNDAISLAAALQEIRPDEVYNLGAQSHVRVSFDIPEYTADVVAMGTVRLLEAIRRVKLECRFYQASSSEMFGSTPPPQSENTRFHPRSPYACGKVFAHQITVNYRESYGLHACCGILFNHESPRRGETFVTRKITRGVAQIKLGLQDALYLGNLEARRDWGFAGDYVEAMWTMLQQDRADDYVIGTGESHSVREFVEAAFARAGLDWRKYVKIDARYFRPAEVDDLRADCTKARQVLGWQASTGFRGLVEMMVDADIAALERQLKGGTAAVRNPIGAGG
ncbi:MAG TPA: GDP-mannose 4,6-dehydratase [Candidatus Solibacter sp.]|nr:GDP-mannose 4,6-dehydratase [Candidatus Solibacter sp.]